MSDLEDSGLDYIIALGKAEWDSLRWDASIAEKKDIINRSDLMFTASKNVEAYKKSVEKLLNKRLLFRYLIAAMLIHIVIKLIQTQRQ